METTPSKVRISEHGREFDEDVATLVRTETCDDNDVRCVRSVEYRRPNSEVIVHRSVHVDLKRLPDAMEVVQGHLR